MVLALVNPARATTVLPDWSESECQTNDDELINGSDWEFFASDSCMMWVFPSVWGVFSAAIRTLIRGLPERSLQIWLVGWLP